MVQHFRCSPGRGGELGGGEGRERAVYNMTSDFILQISVYVSLLTSNVSAREMRS